MNVPGVSRKHQTLQNSRGVGGFLRLFLIVLNFSQNESVPKVSDVFDLFKIVLPLDYLSTVSLHPDPAPAR